MKEKNKSGLITAKTTTISDGAIHQREKERRIMKPLIVFLHVPKTAGSSLATILNKNFKGRVLNVRAWDNDPGDLKNIDCIHGHIPMSYINCFIEPLKREKKYITILRDPIHRSISWYRYRNKLRGLEWKEFVSMKSLFTFNSFTKMFRSKSPDEDIELKDIEDCIYQLQEKDFTVFNTFHKDGVFRGFSSILEWCDEMGFEYDRKKVRHNITNNNIPVDDNMKEIVCARNFFDCVLYHDLLKLYGLKG